MAKKIDSLSVELLRNGVMVVLCALVVAVMGDLSLSKVTTRSGLMLTYISVILTAYEIVRKPEFLKRECELLELDNRYSLFVNFEKMNSFSNDDWNRVREMEEKFFSEIYEELVRIYSFRDYAVAHVKFGVFFVGVGTVLQIIGTM